MTKQLFLSHAWGNDNLNRDNHARCKLIHDKLKERHYSVWLDDNEMYGNIDSATMKGIDGASAILLCLTEKYCNKINNAVNNNSPNDNCYKEWNYKKHIKQIILLAKKHNLDNILIINGLCKLNINYKDYYCHISLLIKG